ncbi:MAG TPA: hypothetical protein PKY46_07690 [Ignavibacteriaceae bacterium]|nr:hypothetical protein [Ignavibacteriaceae bacterium]
MKKTLIAINSLLDLGILKKYAIAGGMAQFYYIEPSVTYDLDLIVNIGSEENSLTPLSQIYTWAEKNNYLTDNEHIMIEGIPVQFLLEYNPLVSEALDNSRNISLFEVNTSILEPEYLMAIMLQTRRPADYERLIRFFSEADPDPVKFNSIINKFGLEEKYDAFRRRFL